MNRTCASCGASFHAFPSEVANGRGIFCSRACHGRFKTANAPGRDRDKLLASKRRYRARHLEQDRERNRLWREANPEYIKAANDAWRAANPRAGVEGVVRWRENNPERQHAAARAGACNRRARAAQVDGHISVQEVWDLWVRQPMCLHCGEGRGVDHIVPFHQGGLNVIENLQNLCQLCNSRKQGKMNPDKVRVLRASFANGLQNKNVLAAQFGITRSMVWAIVSGKSWKDVL